MIPMPLSRDTSILDCLPDACILLDMSWKFTYLNSNAERLLRRSKESLLGKSIRKEYPSLVNEEFSHALHQAVAQQTMVQIHTDSFLPVCRLHMTFSPIPNGLCLIFRCVPEQIQLTEKPEQSPHHLQLALRLARLGSWEWEVETGFLTVSDQMKQILGLEPDSREEDVIASLERIEVGDWEMLLAGFSGAKIGKQVEFRSRYHHPGGSVRYLDMAYELVIDEGLGTRRLIGVVRDVTDMIQNQEKLLMSEELARKSEKLTLTGQLAAGIAHEIRNPLTAIKGFFQLVDSGFTMKKEHVRLMSSELMRIEEILNELLLLAKPHDLKFWKKDMNQIVGQVIMLMETEANLKHVRLNAILDEQPLYVNCDENQLKQVFINLIKNGLESMPQGGVMTVTTSSGGGVVMVRFTDQGTGILPEQMDRLGQPFFTTKEKGTGLGLAVSFTIIENHKGTVSIKSEPGQGATFLVSIPCSSQEPFVSS